MQNHPVQTDEFLSDAQLCAMLRVTTRTTGRWRVEGNGPAFIRAGGRRVLYRRTDLDVWLAKRTFAHRAAEALTGAHKPPTDAAANSG
jgi:Helix-turn-helix domain